MKKLKYIALSLLTLGFIACENDELDELRAGATEEEVVLPALVSGEADFSNYVAIGASFTAGFTDGALFIAAQENSFPNIMSQQFANVGSGDFTQPLMNDNIGGFVFGSTVVANPRLFFNGAGPAVLPATPTTEITTNIYNSSTPFTNMGVPGAKSTHINFVGYGSSAGNPYFARMASSPAATMLGDAIAQNPTFFTLSEIGGNDVLGYATSGGESDVTSDDYDPITPTATFNFVTNDMVNQLLATGAKGVITNVPNITDLPHFTTVGHDVIPLDAGTAAAVNNAYAGYNGGLLFAQSNSLIDANEVAQRTINFTASANNAVVIEDESLTDLTGFGIPSYRQATANDLIVLPAASFIGTEAVVGNPLTVNGVAIPLADRWVLVPSEQMDIQDATDAYNATIATIASTNLNITLVDLNAILTEASTTGIAFDNYTMNTSLVFGGLVSLDGIHLTARGYALMANKFLEAIDATYGSNFIASGNVAKAEDYPVNYSPSLQ